jgi:DNA repair protein RadC
MEVRERPREKLSAGGAAALSDVELLALLLGSGGRKQDVLTLAARLSELLDLKGSRVSIDDLTQVDGIGTAKASLIIAAIEFARRRIRPAGTKVRCPADAFALVRHLAGRKQELFITISLNGAHEVIATRVITVGLVNRSQVHPREVFADPITDRAAAIIAAHNHPSGELIPSKEDFAVTTRLADAGKILGIQLLDHVIFSERGYCSLEEMGKV